MLMVSTRHIPVLLEEAIRFLDVQQGGTYVDATLGTGGHAEKILTLLNGSGWLIAIDRDSQALEEARDRLAGRFTNVSFHLENFRNLPLLLNGLGIEHVNGCLFDLGASSAQLDNVDRGFSFRGDGPLDMRMDQRSQTTAADLVNRLPEQELADLFWQYGEEKSARRIAGEIARERKARPFRTTLQLAELVSRVKRAPARPRRHPATQVFQALRIKVNRELEGLGSFLEETAQLLEPNGRLVVISFHSLEDRIVKTAFRRLEGRCVCFRPPDSCTCPRQKMGRNLTARPVLPGEEEISANPRSRSARLRAFERSQNRNEGNHGGV